MTDVGGERRKIDLRDVTIVVLSHNRRTVVARNVPALTRMAQETGCELVVVDNASADGSAEFIREALSTMPNARFILNATNLGVAAGRNSGWAVAGRDYILNLDDDVSVTAEDVSHMAGLLRSGDSIGAVAPKIVDFTTGLIQYSYGDTAIEIANFQGACHMVRRDLVQKIGMNDEKCSFGGEELDLSVRIRAAGKMVLFTPLASVAHDHQVRQGAEAWNRRSRWVYNFTRVYHKHFPIGFATILSLRFLVSNLAAGMRAHGPTVAPTLVREAIRGMRDGRRSHNAVPPGVVSFYRNPDLRPEFGNVPLGRKLMTRLASPSSTGTRR